MNNLMHSFEPEEREALEAAAGAMAAYWKDCGLGEHVRAIGRDRGLMGAMVMLSAYYSERHRQTEKRGGIEGDAIPF